MALISTDQKLLRKNFSVQTKSLMLKDYLRDDLSSCSSSGFKSFPRRQCCTTVRFLLEIDLKSTQNSRRPHRQSCDTKPKRLLQRSPCKTISALQRASEALLHAFNQFPFPSVKSPSSSAQQKREKTLVPRSLSLKLLKWNFWRKASRGRNEQTIERWKKYPNHLQEQRQSSDRNTRQCPTTSITSTSSSNSKSNSWAESDFSTVDMLQSSSSVENDTVESKNDVSSSVYEDSTTITNSEENTEEQDKQQFSPVSVLDCPFEDEKHINSPPFEHRLALAPLEGTNKRKLLKKLRRFERLGDLLKPVDLEKRIAAASSALDNETSSLNNNTFDENETKNKARELLKIVKSTSPSSSLTCQAADNLLLDFFEEKITENKQQQIDQLLKEAQDWIVNGQLKELMLMGWEVEDGRKAYVNDMEKYGSWTNILNAVQEKQEVGRSLELQLFTSLIDDLLLDLIF